MGPASPSARITLVAFTLGFLAGVLFALPPAITLLSPVNGESTTDPAPVFSWVASSASSPSLTCSLYVDDSVAAGNMRAESGAAQSAKAAFPLAVGGHRWFVVCWDTMGSGNSSAARTLTIAFTARAALPAEAIPVFVSPSGKGPGKNLAAASFMDDLLKWPTVLAFPMAVLPALLIIFMLMGKKRSRGY